MHFQIPQFIEVEDTVIGPFTFKQFIYVLGGLSLSYTIYKSLPLFLAAPIVVAVMGLALALAYYKVNERPFILTLEAGFYYLVKKKLYLWKKQEKKTTHKEIIKAPQQTFVPKLSEHKLKDIAWSLDIKESIYAGQKNRPETGDEAIQKAARPLEWQ